VVVSRQSTMSMGAPASPPRARKRSRPSTEPPSPPYDLGLASLVRAPGVKGIRQQNQLPSPPPTLRPLLTRTTVPASINAASTPPRSHPWHSAKKTPQSVAQGTKQHRSFLSPSPQQQQRQQQQKIQQKILSSSPHRQKQQQHQARQKTPTPFNSEDLVRLSSVGVFLLRGKSPVPVAGDAEMTVLRGAVSVLAYTAYAGSVPVKIHSAPLSPFLITLTPVTPSPSHHEEASLRPPVLTPDVQAALLEQQLAPMGVYAVVLFTPLYKPSESPASTLAPFLAHIPLPIAGLDPTASGSGSGIDIVTGFCVAGRDAKAAQFQLWDEWKMVEQALRHSGSRGLNVDSSVPAPLRVLVCGDGGTGKSMLSRCLVNHLLSSGHERVVYVETDVGQPELTPAGLISAHEVTAPLLGGAASHNAMLPGIASRYFGDNTPSEHARVYAEAVSSVVESARAYAGRVGAPIVVNSDGWVGGTGGYLLEHLVTAVAPSHVFCTAFAIGPGYLQNQQQQPGVAIPGALPQAVLAAASSVQPERTTVLRSMRFSKDTTYSASLLRELNHITYFGPALLSGIVHAVSLRDVNLAFLGEAMPGTHILEALNGSVICLASTQSCTGHSSSWRALGLGLVRGVDAARGELHVSTPLRARALVRVDAIAMSSGGQATAALYLGMAHGKAAPYVVEGVVGGSDSMRSRGSLQRR
jgi:hypothetical protein